jgi:TonB-dependent receptor
MLKSKNLLLTVFIVFIINLNLSAQDAGKISGKITDQKTSETLIGATIAIDGTSKAVAADVDGKYLLSGLQPGKYALTIKYIGYQTKAISDVEVKAGEVTNLDIILSEAATQALGEVVVKATFRQASIASLYAQQKNSVSISDGVSADAIKRSPDRNTADVLKRVSGATVQDNKFVVVRGLSDRYNNAMLDGAWLPSTEPNRKAFSFDIVPSNLIEALTITKTATPDQPADFAGGLINIATKDIPDQNFISFSVGGGYNTASTFKDFKSGTRNATDYLGFDNGDKQLPSGFPSYAKIANGLPQQTYINALAKLLPSYNYTIYHNTALPSQNYQFTIGKVKDFEKSNNRLGAIFALTYRNSQNIQSDILSEYYGINYTDNVYKFSTNVGALLNLGYSFGKSKITFKNIYNRIYDDQFLQRTGSNQNVGSSVKAYAFDLLQKALLKSTLEGNHPIGEKGSKINWVLSYNNVLNDQPNQRKISYYGPLNGNGPYSANVTSQGKENATLFSKLNENAYSAAVNYSKPVKILGQSATFKAGASTLYRDRAFSARFLGPVLNGNNPNIDQEAIRKRSLSNLFSRDLIAANAYLLQEINSPVDSYSATSSTNSGYLMLDNKFGKKLRIVWGARVEQFNLDLSTTDKDPSNRAKQNYTNVLPSANLTYSVTDKINFRASYSRTLARPEFRELARSQYYDYELLASIVGSPALKKATIDNADIRFEFYPSAGQIISVSGFYKKFKNAIETFNDDAASTRQITYFNSDKADVYGAELEVRKSLDFISQNDFFKSTTAYANVAVIKSTAVNPINGYTFIEKERPLVGQAPYVINAGLQHTFLGDKLSFNALYNRVGRRLSIAAGGLFEGVWEAPRNVLDMQLGIKMLKSKGELKLNAGDVLNQGYTFYYDMNKSGKYDAGDQTQSSFKPGTNYSFTFSYTF